MSKWTKHAVASRTFPHNARLLAAPFIPRSTCSSTALTAEKKEKATPA